jgi:hypothetical protein
MSDIFKEMYKSTLVCVFPCAQNFHFRSRSCFNSLIFNNISHNDSVALVRERAGEVSANFSEL